uniref:Uncharacterized protein n=1 Tax=Anguilla anguilla TaxID=7936 RepID=A0A0E9RI17_ANGAN
MHKVHETLVNKQSKTRSVPICPSSNNASEIYSMTPTIPWHFNLI